MSDRPVETNNAAPEAFASFNLVIEPLSDWHVGTGAGIQGYIDSTVYKDADGLPQLGAKTVFGILRDSCEAVAYGLDEGNDGYWLEVLRFLFGKNNEGGAGTGSNSKAALSIGTARFSAEFRDMIVSRYPRLKPALTFVQPSVKINKQTGQSLENALRFTEMVRAGIPLYSFCELALPENEDEQRACCALLAAAAAYLHHFGAGRRRGAGKCKAFIEDVDTIKKWLGWLEKNKKIADGSVFNGKLKEPGGESESEEAESDDSVKNKPDGETGTSDDTGWRKIIVRIEVEDPVQIFSRQTGNVVKTLDFIPGTYLLRLLYRLLPEKTVNEALATGKLLVTDATPEAWVENSERVPVSHPGYRAPGILGRPKAPAGGKTFVLKSSRQERDEGEIMESLGGSFLAWDGTNALPFKTPVTHNTHNAVLDKSQRPESDTGGVYSYQAIAPGCTLTTEIRYQSDLAQQIEAEGVDALRKKLEGGSRLGRSKKDYGAVHIEMAGEPGSCVAVGGNLDDGATSEGESDALPMLTIWLLSDLLLGDACGRTRPIELLQETLEKEIQASVSDSISISTVESDYRSEVFHTSVRPIRRDSWHAGWGLPRPTLSGLAAGSVITFKIEGLDRNDKEKKKKLKMLLRRLEASGIGDRCAEGFGQLCFNHKLTIGQNFTVPAAEIHNRKPRETAAATQAMEAVPEANGKAVEQNAELYKLLGRDALREAIRQKSMEIASDPGARKDYLGFKVKSNGDSKPTLSQIGLLRMVLQYVKEIPEKGCEEGEGAGTVISWFKHIEEKAGKKEKDREEWKGGAIGKIRQLVCPKNEKDDIWKILNIRLFQYGVDENSEAAIKKEMAPEAVRAFFDACARAHKRECERKKKSSGSGGGRESGEGPADGS